MISVVQHYTSKSEESTGRPWFFMSVHDAANMKPSDDDFVKAIVLTGATYGRQLEYHSYRDTDIGIALGRCALFV